MICLCKHSEVGIIETLPVNKRDFAVYLTQNTICPLTEVSAVCLTPSGCTLSPRIEQCGLSNGKVWKQWLCGVYVSDKNINVHPFSVLLNQWPVPPERSK